MWVMCTSTLPARCCELVAERCRAQMAADAGELALLVAERGLDHEVRDHLREPLPERRVRAGVAGVDPPAGAPPSTAKPTAGTVCAASAPRCACR